MNYLDVIIIISLIFGAVTGISRGLIKEITGLFSIIIGAYFALNFSEIIEPKFKGIFDQYEEFKPILIFVILFISTIVVIKLTGKVIEKFVKAVALGMLNKLFGGVFGFLKIAIVLSFLFFLESKTQIIPKNIKNTSILHRPIEEILIKLNPSIEKHKTTFKKIEQKTKETKRKIKQNFNQE